MTEHPKAAWRVTSYEQVVDAVKIILKELNGGNRQDIAQAIHDTVRRDHRTLQQAFWSAMLMAQIEYSKDGFDARNEDSVRLAEAVRKLAIAMNFDMGLPYV